MSGRVTRVYKNKVNGFIFCPSDPKMLRALKMIDGGIVNPAIGEPSPKSKPDPDRPDGPAQTIEALNSEAHINGVPLFPEFNPEPVRSETQSEIETRLRREINHTINRVVGSQHAGNRKTVSRIFWLKVKFLVNNGRNEKGRLIKKAVSEMTIPELKIIADFCKNNY